MFLPCTAGTLDSNGLFPSASVLSVMTALYNDIKASEGAIGGFQSCVVSVKLGTFATISSLSADTRPDIQRRRANRQTKGSLQSLPFTRP